MTSNDGLSLEYKLVNGCARRNFDLSDVVNDPVGLGVVWISGYSLVEQLVDFLCADAGSVRDDSANLLLVGHH